MKDYVQMERAATLKRIRSIVRTEAAILADRILNEVEDEALTEINRRVQAGEPLVLVEFDGWLRENVNERFRPALEAESRDEVH